MDVKHRVGLELPVREPLGQFDTVGEVDEDRQREMVTERELEAEGLALGLKVTLCVGLMVELRHSEEVADDEEEMELVRHSVGLVLGLADTE